MDELAEGAAMSTPPPHPWPVDRRPPEPAFPADRCDWGDQDGGAAVYLRDLDPGKYSPGVWRAIAGAAYWETDDGVAYLPAEMYLDILRLAEIAARREGGDA